MAKAHLEIFQSEYHMLKFFGKYLPKLDVDSSAKLAPFLYCYDGELVLSRNLYEFLTQIEDMTGLGIDTRASVQKGPTFLLFFHDQPKTPEKFNADVGEINVARQNVIPSDESDDGAVIPLVQTNIISPVPEVKTEDEEKTSTVRSGEQKDEILAHAESLRDDSKKSAAKSALEEFALTHDISLSRAKTFDGMLEDLRAAL